MHRETRAAGVRCNRDWHRLPGVFLTVYFKDSPHEVEIERDLSSKRQLLDMSVIQQHADMPFDRYPDGLENMARYNLISYKSLHEAFGLWSLLELLGHYVNYRKQIGPPESGSPTKLVPANQFRLYGITTRMPGKLIKLLNFTKISPGVYELVWGETCIRLIVLSRIPEGPHNAIWRLFSAKPDIVEEAREQYTAMQNSDCSLIMQTLFEYYLKEKLPMSYTLEQFREDFVLSHLKSIPPDKILKQYSPEELLKEIPSDQVLQRFSAEERLKNLSPEERLKNLSPEDVFKQYSPEDMLKGLSPEQLDTLIRLSKKPKSH